MTQTPDLPKEILKDLIPTWRRLAGTTSRPPPRRFVPQYMSEWADRGEWPSTNRRPFRAYLVSKRVRLGGAKSASFTRGTASCELFLLASSSVFEAFLLKRAIRIDPPSTSGHQKGLTLTLTTQALIP